jgi:uncharacterized membrane protein
VFSFFLSLTTVEVGGGKSSKSTIYGKLCFFYDFIESFIIKDEEDFNEDLWRLPLIVPLSRSVIVIQFEGLRLI